MRNSKLPCPSRNTLMSPHPGTTDKDGLIDSENFSEFLYANIKIESNKTNESKIAAKIPCRLC